MTTNATLAAKLTKHFPEVTVDDSHTQNFDIITPEGHDDFTVFATDGKFETAYKLEASSELSRRAFIATYKSQRALIAAIATELGVNEA